jgi:nitrite reductase/ring-hydroxylating ferredoxin subunit
LKVTSKAANEILTDVEGTAPMGQMLRHYWCPVLRSDYVEPGGAPRKVRLFGNDHVVFRNKEGRVGMMDEKCPHRCASLQLARNEEDGLRCIFHGWKFDMDGNVVEMPTEDDPERAAALSKKVPVQSYPAKDVGGLIWVYVGNDVPPPFPEFEFTVLPDNHRDIRAGYIRCNWLQAMESILDSAHLGFLHRSSIAKASGAASQQNAGLWLKDTAPRLDFETTDYGLREAAIRKKDGDLKSVRIREIIAPWHVILPGEDGAERQHIITVPADTGNCFQFIVTYNPFRPMKQSEIDTIWFDTHPDANNIAAPLPGEDTVWGQDRQAMEEGHFSGLTDRHVFAEDFAVLESMGPVADRTREFLTHTDRTLVIVRKALLKSIEDMREDKSVWGHPQQDHGFRTLRTYAKTISEGEDWRNIGKETVSAT